MEPTEFRTGTIKPIECAKEAWAIIKPNYWLLFATCVVGIWISGVTLYILLGAMFCGIFVTLLKAVDGRQPEFPDLFKGFRYFGPGFVVMLFFAVPLLAVYSVIYGPVIYAIYTDPGMSNEKLMALMTGSLIIDLVLVLAVVCFHTLLVFAFPLVIDRGFGPVRALVTSTKAVWANLNGVVGVIVVQMALSFLGGLLLCFGIYFVVPVIFAVYAVAYRKVFPDMAAPHLNPPPPNAYSGLQ